MADAPKLTGTAGVILAGGASSRFGSNKALASYQGQPLIASGAAVLAGLFHEQLLVTNTPEIYRFLGWPMVGDYYRDAGPLAGIHAALTTITAERAMVVACDMPMLNAPLIRFLCDQGTEWDVVLPRLANGHEPLHAVYHKRCLPVIERHLRMGQRKLWQLLADLKVREIDEQELLAVVPDLSPFHNVNRPEDLATKTFPQKPLTLAAAQRLLRQHIAPTATETIPLGEALGRIPVVPVRAPFAVPSFCQSTRDGFAVRRRDLRHASAGSPVTLVIRGEIAAGDTAARQIDRGETLRIMTGARLPTGADAVVPFEEAHEAGGTIRLTAPLRRNSHLRPPGTDCRANQILLPAGRPIMPYDLARMAPAGVARLMVHAMPRAGYLCTGSELTDDAANLQPGQIISGNRPLLQALLRQSGAEPVDLGTVPDTVAALTSTLTAAQSQRLSLCITTGGMGPGKYDLVTHALEQLGAHILYHSLKVRPGKATLAATINGLLFIALPGPPPAVHLLFHELITPLIRQAQGSRQRLPKPIKATLTTSVQVRQSGVLHLKEAVLFPANGSLLARLPRQGESPNAILLVPPTHRTMRTGEPATLHLLPT